MTSNSAALDHYLSWEYDVICCRVKLEAEKQGIKLTIREIVERADKIIGDAAARPACSGFAPSHEDVSRPSVSPAIAKKGRRPFLSGAGGHLLTEICSGSEANKIIP